MKKHGYQPKKRNSRTRREKRVLLLAAEGKNKTETNYFSKFKSDKFVIRFVRGNETDPVRMTKQLLRDYEELDLSDADYAACLVDSDFDTKKDVQLKQADKLIAKAKQDNVALIVSGPCFEIWYLCHFVYTTAAYNNTADVLHQLEKYIPGYKKGNEDTFFSLLQGKTKVAIANAKRLEKYCKDARKQMHRVEFMPSTEVYKVFEYFLRM